jgi:hypothetical protein
MYCVVYMLQYLVGYLTDCSETDLTQPHKDEVSGKKTFYTQYTVYDRFY